MDVRQVFANPSALDGSTREGRAIIMGAITHYLQQPAVIARKLWDAGVRELTVPGDFPAAVQDLFLLFHNRFSIDMSPFGFFDVRDYTGSRRAGFALRNVSTGLTFTVKKPGEKAKLYKVSGTSAYYEFLHLAGGLEYDQDWFDDQDWWTVANQTVEFGSAYYRAKATYAYALVTAIGGGQNTAWVAGASELERDVATINSAVTSILADMATAKIPVDANARFVLRAPPALKARLNRALGTGYQFPAQTGQRVEFTVSPEYTTLLTGTNYYVGLPGMQNVWGDRMNLTVLTELDKLAWAQLAVGHARYVGVIGQEDQIRRCATA